MVKHLLIPCLAFTAACSYTPAGRERAHVHDTLQAMPEVTQVSVGCEGAIFAGDSLCADIVVKDGKTIRFERAGFRSIGSNAVNVVVAEAGGLVPLVASCDGIAPPNFHREAPLGHHFQPTLIDVKDAVTRSGDVLEEVQYWPRCPMSWEVQDRRGVNFRYCARKKDETSEPPRPDVCTGVKE